MALLKVRIKLLNISAKFSWSSSVSGIIVSLRLAITVYDYIGLAVVLLKGLDGL